MCVYLCVCVALYAHLYRISDLHGRSSANSFVEHCLFFRSFVFCPRGAHGGKKTCRAEVALILLCGHICSNPLQTWSNVCVCVCVCVRERERERESIKTLPSATIPLCVCVCVCACVCVCVCVTS